MATIEPDRCPDHPDSEPRLVVVNRTTSHQPGSRAITEWRCSVPTCRHYPA